VTTFSNSSELSAVLGVAKVWQTRWESREMIFASRLKCWCTFEEAEAAAAAP
jgi:hypothetical protein